MSDKQFVICARSQAQDTQLAHAPIFCKHEEAEAWLKSHPIAPELARKGAELIIVERSAPSREQLTSETIAGGELNASNDE